MVLTLWIGIASPNAAAVEFAHFLSCLGVGGQCGLPNLTRIFSSGCQIGRFDLCVADFAIDLVPWWLQCLITPLECWTSNILVTLCYRFNWTWSFLLFLCSGEAGEQPDPVAGGLSTYWWEGSGAGSFQGNVWCWGSYKVHLPNGIHCDCACLVGSGVWGSDERGEATGPSTRCTQVDYRFPYRCTSVWQCVIYSG